METLGVLLFAAGVAGLIRPAWLRSKSRVVPGIVLIVGMVLVGATGGNGDEPAATADVATKTEELAPDTVAPATEGEETDIEGDAPGDDAGAETPSLGFTPEQFRDAWNAVLYDGPHITSWDFSEGDVNDVVQARAGDYVALIISMPTGTEEVHDVTMIGAGDGSLTSGADIMLGFLGVVAASAPDLPATERSDVLRELGLLGDDVDITQVDSETIRGGVRFWARFSEGLGFFMGASAAAE